MSKVIDAPSILDGMPKFFEDAFTDDSEEIGGNSDFPDAVIMVSYGGGKYGAVNITTTGPDPMTTNALVCFATDAEAETWETATKLAGEHVNKSFHEALDIVKSKPNISALALQVGGKTAAIHWVR